MLDGSSYSTSWLWQRTGSRPCPTPSYGHEGYPGCHASTSSKSEYPRSSAYKGYGCHR